MNKLKAIFKRGGVSREVIGSNPPVFVFAACWRTGSTLLQRVITASGDLLIWGEPSSLKEVEDLFSKNQAYLGKQTYHANKFYDGKAAVFGKSGQWIPTISPDPARSVAAIQKYFIELYGVEAAELGYERWGFKEVRRGAKKYIQMLRILFPGARFIFLLRHPMDVFLSLQGKKFYQKFSDPMTPMMVWRDNVEQCVIDDAVAGEDLLIVKYEDIVSPEQSEISLQKICQHVDVRLTPRMEKELSIVVDPSSQPDISDENIKAVQALVAETAGKIGYDF